MSLPDFIKAKMEELGLKARALGTRLGHSSNGLVADVVNKGRPVPLDKIEIWERALELNDQEKAEFRAMCLSKQSEPLGKDLKATYEIQRQLVDATLAQVIMRIRMAQLRRKMLGASTKDLADKAGVDPGEFARAWQLGEGSPRVMQAVANALDVPLIWILRGEQDPQWYLDLVSVDFPDPAWHADHQRATP